MKWPIAVLTCVVMGAGCGGGNESGRGIAFDSASGNDEGPGGELDDEGPGGELDDGVRVANSTMRVLKTKAPGTDASPSAPRFPPTSKFS
jgi:hypothetical protein